MDEKGIATWSMRIARALFMHNGGVGEVSGVYSAEVEDVALFSGNVAAKGFSGHGGNTLADQAS